MIDYQVMSNELVTKHIYNKLTWPEVDAVGAWGKNADPDSPLNIEQQRYGENLIISGVLHSRTDVIDKGLQVFDWGFAHQAADGSFAGTVDPFHQTGLFISSVARACLFVRRSPYDICYDAKVTSFASRVHMAAKWMVTPEVWSRGLANNNPYTHRRYITACALSLSGNFDGGDGRLGDYARSQIRNAISLQLECGINIEKAGYDVSYQGVGLLYAAIWADYFSRDVLVTAINEMALKGLSWEETMVNPEGSINLGDSTRVGGEVGPSGTLKVVDWRKVALAFIYWSRLLSRPSWFNVAERIVNYYS